MSGLKLDVDYTLLFHFVYRSVVLLLHNNRTVTLSRVQNLDAINNNTLSRYEYLLIFSLALSESAGQPWSIKNQCLRNSWNIS